MDMGSIEVSASGMRAQRRRMDLIAANLANVDTTSVREDARRDAEGNTSVRHVPYRRQTAIFARTANGGVEVVGVAEDPAAFRSELQPGHPHAVPAGQSDAGMLYLPNVNPMVEMVEMMSASRAYEANLTAVEAAKAMNQSALRILA
jgi:flagellar basal-body rod protein FlgC